MSGTLSASRMMVGAALGDGLEQRHDRQRTNFGTGGIEEGATLLGEIGAEMSSTERVMDK